MRPDIRELSPADPGGGASHSSLRGRFKQMQGLKRLILYDSDLSQDEIHDLRQALPGCAAQQANSKVLEQMREAAWE